MLSKIIFPQIIRIPFAVIILFCMGAISSLIVPPPAYSGEITLAWDENTDPDVAGYKLYFGNSSGVYQSFIDVAKNTTWRVGNLNEGETYYITATAYDLSGNESAFANQIEVTLPAPAPVTNNFILGINCGGPQYLGQGGILYQADTYFDGGRTYINSSPIQGTDDDLIYQSERWGSFSYKIPLANGRYTVTLKFAEIYPYSWGGSRVFDVSIQGRNVLRNLDVFAMAAGVNKPYDVTLPAYVADGMLTIYFRGIVGSAALNAILVKSF